MAILENDDILFEAPPAKRARLSPSASEEQVPLSIAVDNENKIDQKADVSTEKMATQIPEETLKVAVAQDDLSPIASGIPGLRMTVQNATPNPIGMITFQVPNFICARD